MLDCDDLGTNLITITVTDAAGNSNSNPVTVTVLDLAVPVLTSCPEDMVFNDCDVVVNYAMPTFTDNCDATATLVSGLESGATFPIGQTEVAYIIEDAAGNSTSCSFMVTVDYDLELTASVTSPSCPGFSDGFAGLNVTGGAAPFFIMFEGGGDPVGLAAGTYGVTVVDNAGCSIETAFTVEDPPLLTYEFGDITPATNGQMNGSAILNIDGGTPPYNFQWILNGMVVSTAQNPTNLAPGEYFVQVSDDRGCNLSTSSIVIDNMVGTQQNEYVQHLNIFPNPTSGLLNIQMELSKPLVVAIDLLDVSGQIITPITANANAFTAASYEANLSHLPNGVYWLRIVAEDAVITKRIVLMQ